MMSGCLLPFYSSTQQFERTSTSSVIAIARGPSSSENRCVENLREAAAFFVSTQREVSPGNAIEIFHLSPKQLQSHDKPSIRYTQEAIQQALEQSRYLAQHPSIEDNPSTLADQAYLSNVQKVRFTI